MTLPPGWTIKDKPKEDKSAGLPEGWSIKKTPEEDLNRDVVSEQQRAAGFEPDFFDTSAEFERAAERGTAEATRGLISGGTFGLSENVPGLKTGDNIAATTGKILGSVFPIGKLIDVFGVATGKLAAKSPVFQKQLASLGNILGVFATGATVKGTEDIFKGKLPSQDDLLEHGIEWAALDVALQVLGATGRFAKSLLGLSKSTGRSPTELLGRTIEELKAEGIDFKNADVVGAKALEILERQTAEAATQAPARKVEQIKKQPTTLESTAKERFAEEPITPQDLKTRKIKEDQTHKLSERSLEQPEPYQPSESSFTKEAEALERGAVEHRIEGVGERAASEEALGTAVKEDIETQLEALKSEYRPLYKVAQEAAEQAVHIPRETAKEAGTKLINLSKLKTSPEGYKTVIKNLETVLEDAGYTIQKDEKGNITQILSTTEVPVENTIELARRLNEMVDYEAIEPTVKEALRSVARAAKRDVRAGLANNKDGLAAFELAEAEHARVAGKFGKDSIKKIRESQAGEKVGKMTNAASTLGDLKEVLSPQQYMQVEREMLERLNTQSHDKAKKTLREIESHLSAQNKKLAQDIVESKNPYNVSVRKKNIQEGVLNDMSNALTTGQRPDKTLNLWKTSRGQKLVKEAFKDSPNWPEVKNYLEKQSFNDMVSSVLKKDGTIDFDKFKSFMKDQATVNNIRNMGGEEAVTFFKNLDSQVKQFESNVKLLDNLPSKSEAKRGEDLISKTKQKNAEPPKAKRIGEEKIAEGARRKKETTGEQGSKILERMAAKDFPVQAKTKKWRAWFTETMGMNEKGVMSVFGLMKLGLPHTVGSLIGYRMFNKMLTSKKLRSAFTEAAKKRSDPLKFILSVEHLGDVMDEELIEGSK